MQGQLSWQTDSIRLKRFNSFEKQATTLSTSFSQQITDVQFLAHHHSFNQLTLDIDIVIMTVSYSLNIKHIGTYNTTITWTKTH